MKKFYDMYLGVKGGQKSYKDVDGDWVEPKLQEPPSMNLEDLTDEHALIVGLVLGKSYQSEHAAMVATKELLTTNQLYVKVTNLSGWDWLRIFRKLEELGYKLPTK